MEKAHLKFWAEVFWYDLYKLCQELGLNEKQIIETVSESFVDLWKMRKEVIGYTNIKAFLYITTRRYALELLQKETLKYIKS